MVHLTYMKKVLLADEVIPVHCTFKTKLNSYGGLDKLKAKMCIRGDMQIKESFNNWSPIPHQQDY